MDGGFYFGGGTPRLLIVVLIGDFFGEGLGEGGFENSDDENHSRPKKDTVRGAGGDADNILGW